MTSGLRGGCAVKEKGQPLVLAGLWVADRPGHRGLGLSP